MSVQQRNFDLSNSKDFAPGGRLYEYSQLASPSFVKAILMSQFLSVDQKVQAIDKLVESGYVCSHRVARDYDRSQPSILLRGDVNQLNFFFANSFKR